MENRSRTIPTPTRPIMPDGYGVPENDEGLLDWGFVDQRMRDSLNYWISTTRPDGRPHATPVWGVWVDGRVYFDGSPATRRGRNLAANPAVSVHLESGSEVVIVEGQALPKRPERSLAERLAAEYARKYANQGYSPEPDQWDQGGLYEVDPQIVLAWGEFPKSVTRWVFTEK
jgi:nitroimidazol reductase NimA-like FMN-containing flavoprotein (pyridoxamine 5'-phosphate oxidase superfamily)